MTSVLAEEEAMGRDDFICGHNETGIIRDTALDINIQTLQQLRRQRPKCRLGAGADLQLQKDMFDVRFHCLG